MDNNQIKVLVCDDTAAYGIRTASALREMGLYAYTRRNDSASVFNAILSDRPDAVVADLSLADTDAVSIMKQSQSLLSNCPAFIIVSDIYNTFIEKQVIESGASYFLIKPFEPERLCQIVKSVVCRDDLEECTDVEIMVTDMIQRLGIPAHIKGYQYLRSSIIGVINDRTLIESVTKKLYPYVANIHETTPARAERAMRHAIEIAWSRCSSEILSSFFGCTIDSFHGRPTNSEFIALAADRLRLKIKSATFPSGKPRAASFMTALMPEPVGIRSSL